MHLYCFLQGDKGGTESVSEESKQESDNKAAEAAEAELKEKKVWVP
jgi:hypothetical protein